MVWTPLRSRYGWQTAVTTRHELVRASIIDYQRYSTSESSRVPPRSTSTTRASKSVRLSFLRADRVPCGHSAGFSSCCIFNNVSGRSSTMYLDNLQQCIWTILEHERTHGLEKTGAVTFREIEHALVGNVRAAHDVKGASPDQRVPLQNGW